MVVVLVALVLGIGVCGCCIHRLLASIHYKQVPPENMDPLGAGGEALASSMRRFCAVYSSSVEVKTLPGGQNNLTRLRREVIPF